MVLCPIILKATMICASFSGASLVLMPALAQASEAQTFAELA